MGRHPLVLHHLEYAEAIVRPGGLSVLPGKIIESRFHNRILEAFAEQPEPIAFAWGSQGVDPGVDGGTKYQPAVVVEMVSEKLDSSRGKRCNRALRFTQVGFSGFLFVFFHGNIKKTRGFPRAF